MSRRKNQKIDLAKKLQEEERQKKVEEEQLSKVWTRIKSASQEEAAYILNNLPDEVIQKLNTFANPTKKPVALTTDEAIAISYLDLDKQYKQHFMTTSLIAFVGRMLDEYEPPWIAERNLMSEDDGKFADLMNKKMSEYQRNKPLVVLKAGLINAEGEGNIMEVYRYRLALLRYKKNTNRQDIRLSDDSKNTIEQKFKDAQYKLEGTQKSLELLQKKYEDVKTYTRLTEEGKSTAHLQLTEEDVKRPLEAWERVIEYAKNSLPELETEFKQTKNDHSGWTLNRKTYEDLEEASKQEISTLKTEFMEDDRVKTTDVRPRSVQLNELWRSLKYDMDSIVVTDAEYESVRDEVKKELGIKATKEEVTDKFKDRVEEFFLYYFHYNPDNHVKCAYFPSYRKENLKKITTQEERLAWEEKVRAERDEALKKYERSVVPPADTFHRFNRYLDANYEALRQATDDIYGVPASMEHAFAPLKHFKGSPEKITEEFQTFKEKHAEEFDTDVLLLNMGNWTFVDKWEENRDRIDFYNEKSEILKRIVDRSKEDAKLGQLMTKKRAKTNKADNPGLDQYIQAKDNKLEKYGAQRASESLDIPKDNRLSDPKNEVEVAVFNIKPVPRGKRRFRAAMEKWSFNIEASAPNADNTGIQTVKEHKKHQDDLKKKKKSKQQ